MRTTVPAPASTTSYLPVVGMSGCLTPCQSSTTTVLLNSPAAFAQIATSTGEQFNGKPKTFHVTV